MTSFANGFVSTAFHSVDLEDLARYHAALDFDAWVLDERGMRWAALRKMDESGVLLAETPGGIDALRFLYEAAKVVPGMIRELRELREKVKL